MSDHDDQTDESIREEFLAEANEIIEALSRDLLVLDQADGGNTVDLINDIFRGVHTLKGMAAMFGFTEVGSMAHVLENLLDDLRLGRTDLGREVLDVLFEGVENFQRLLAAGTTGAVDVHAYTASVEKIASVSEPPDDPMDVYAFDPGALSVLTEYEEHRLRSNVAEEVPLYRIQAAYPITSIDVALEQVKERAKPHGEIITYLPSVGEGDPDSIELEILLASRASIDELESAICTAGELINPVPRRGSEDMEPVADTLPPAMQTEEPVPMMDTAVGPEVIDEPVDDVVPVRTQGRTVRVDIRKLDSLMNAVGELSLVRGAVENITERIRANPALRPLALDLYRINRSFERNLKGLQGGILGVRMVPLRQLFDRLARGVRRAAREHDKELRFVVTGSETELDKLIVEELADPLMHMIRNCVDHGIESGDVRSMVGKPPTGTLAVNAYQKGNHVVLEVEDDGAGIDTERLVRVARRKNMLPAESGAELSREEVLKLIFQPGFSTADEVTDLSGRGVGMDVVKNNIARLGGVVDVQSEMGTGTKFTITLPITLAIIRTLIVDVSGRPFTIPLTSVYEALEYKPSAVRKVDGRPVVSVRGSTLELCRLDEFFGIERVPEEELKYIVIVNVGTRTLGLVVDELRGQQDVVIKPFGKSLSSVTGIAGATELGHGSVALVIDAAAILDEVLRPGERALVARAPS